MKFDKLKEKKWFPLATAICIGVLFWFVLTHLKDIGHVFQAIWYFIYPVAAGGILAYLINPLMRFLENHLFKRIKKDGLRKGLAMVTAFIIVILCVICLLGIIIPQLVDGIKELMDKKDAYFNVLMKWLEEIGDNAISVYIKELMNSSRDLLGTISAYITENSDAIQAAISNYGKHITAWGIGVIFSFYFLAEKDSVKKTFTGILRRMSRTEEVLNRNLEHLRNIDSIMTRYLIFSILDGIALGAAVGIFMLIMGMPYAGLIPIIVGLFNLIPTFGPIISTLFGTVILAISSPMQALYFLIFVVIINVADGYIIRPKLFGDTFGVSGLWILAAVTVGGRIFGVIGIVLAIPTAAIIDYLLKNVRRREEKKPEEAEEEAVKAREEGEEDINK